MRTSPHRQPPVNTTVTLEARSGVRPADRDLEVQVWAGGKAGRADPADRRARGHGAPGGDERAAEVGVGGAQAVAVVEHDGEAPAVVVAGERDAPVGGRGDRGAGGSGEVHPRVKAGAAGAV